MNLKNLSEEDFNFYKNILQQNKNAFRKNNDTKRNNYFENY